jgi:hypothetical protein
MGVGIAGPGGAFAVDAGSTVAYYMTLNVAPVVTVTVPGGPFTPGAPLVGAIVPLGQIDGACYHKGQLFVVDAAPGLGQRELLTVNPTTGVMTHVGPLPNWPFTAAIASPTR